MNQTSQTQLLRVNLSYYKNLPQYFFELRLSLFSFFGAFLQLNMLGYWLASEIYVPCLIQDAIHDPVLAVPDVVIDT